MDTSIKRASELITIRIYISTNKFSVEIYDSMLIRVEDNIKWRVIEKKTRFGAYKKKKQKKTPPYTAQTNSQILVSKLKFPIIL